MDKPVDPRRRLLGTAIAGLSLAALWPERVKALVSVSGYLIGSHAANKKPLPPKAEFAWWYQFYFSTERGAQGDANGAPHPEPAAYAKKFVGKYLHRTIGGGGGHNLPQEAPKAFADAILQVVSL